MGNKKLSFRGINMEILIKNACLVTFTEEYGVIPEGYLYIKDGKILALGEGDYTKQSAQAKIIDAGQKIVMPGFVNAHMHCYSTFARGMSLGDTPPSCFVEILDKLWWRLDKKLTKEDLYYSTLIPAMEGIRSGVTTFIDHHASPNCIPGCLDELERALNDAGMRGILCYEVSDRDGKEIALQGLEENIRWIKKSQAKQNSLIQGTFGLHASFTVMDDTMEKAVEAAKKLGVGLHLHVAEDHADQTITLQNTKKRVVKRLWDSGALGSKSIAAHAVWVDEEEKDLLAQSGTWTIHNPRSNMNNAVGAMDFLGILGKGTKVCLGTDGMAASIWPDLRTAALIHKHEKRNPRIVWNELLTLLENNYRLANEFIPVRLGKLEPQAASDVVIYNYIPPTPITKDNFLGHFLFGFAHVQADTVLIHDKIVLENGQFVFLDEKEVARKSREQTLSFWKRFAAK